MNKVSVIIPVYNVERYLHRCIDSVLSQTFSNFELLLIDDGSFDSSGAICDEYARIDNRVKVFHQDNSGVSAARNFGLEQSSSEYITFVDSDDYLSKDYLEQGISVMSKDIDLVMLPITMISNTDEITYCLDIGVIEPKKLIEEFCAQNISRICVSSPCAKIYKKEIIVKNSITFDTTMSLGEDCSFNLLYLTCINRIKNTQNGNYFYMRENEESLFTKFRIKNFDDIVKTHTNIISCAQKMMCSEESIKKETDTHLSSLFPTIVKAVRTATKDECLELIMKISNYKQLKENFDRISWSFFKRIVMKLILKRQYSFVYFLLKNRYHVLRKW